MNLIIFPHQLYNPKFIDLKNYKNIYIIEEPRYFTDFLFHKLKLAYHRASMKKYYDTIKSDNKVKYIEFSKVTDTMYRDFTEIYIYDPYDKKLIDKLNKLLKVNIISNIQFLINPHEITKQNKYRHDAFYKFMRIKYNILVENNKPVGGRWSFDTENRNKLPIDIKINENIKKINNLWTKEAIEYVNKNFSDNYGSLDYFIYPIDRKTSLKWLNEFLKKKLNNFGSYQDAVSNKYNFIYHSILSPMMNIGLLRDIDVVNISYKYYLKHKINIASYEGFIRQIIGWRNYMYTMYKLEGEKMYESNNLDHNNKLLNNKWWLSFDIEPIDYLIDKIKKYAYAHHIERLMFLGNFFLINQIDPKQVYQIFMEWTIDAYDWVMVGNIFSMSQYASNIMTKRPYFSSSNYILKMSNFKKDEWCNIWDACYYSFINKHKNILSKNYATSMQVKNYNKKTEKEKTLINEISNKYKKTICKNI